MAFLPTGREISRFGKMVLAAVALVALFGIDAHAQSQVTDPANNRSFRTVAPVGTPAGASYTVNWNNQDAWQVWNGSAWVAANGYPGQSSITDNVFIETGATVVLSSGVQYNSQLPTAYAGIVRINNLHIAAGVVGGTLNTLSGSVIELTGKIRSYAGSALDRSDVNSAANGANAVGATSSIGPGNIVGPSTSNTIGSGVYRFVGSPRVLLQANEWASTVNEVAAVGVGAFETGGLKNVEIALTDGDLTQDAVFQTNVAIQNLRIVAGRLRLDADLHSRDFATVYGQLQGAAVPSSNSSVVVFPGARLRLNSNVSIAASTASLGLSGSQAATPTGLGSANAVITQLVTAGTLALLPSGGDSRTQLAAGGVGQAAGNYWTGAAASSTARTGSGSTVSGTLGAVLEFLGAVGHVSFYVTDFTGTLISANPAYGLASTSATAGARNNAWSAGQLTSVSGLATTQPTRNANTVFTQFPSVVYSGGAQTLVSSFANASLASVTVQAGFVPSVYSNLVLKNTGNKTFGSYITTVATLTVDDNAVPVLGTVFNPGAVTNYIQYTRANVHTGAINYESVMPAIVYRNKANYTTGPEWISATSASSTALPTSVTTANFSPARVIVNTPTGIIITVAGVNGGASTIYGALNGWHAGLLDLRSGSLAFNNSNLILTSTAILSVGTPFTSTDTFYNSYGSAATAASITVANALGSFVLGTPENSNVSAFDIVQFPAATGQAASYERVTTASTRSGLLNTSNGGTLLFNGSTYVSSTEFPNTANLAGVGVGYNGNSDLPAIPNSNGIGTLAFSRSTSSVLRLQGSVSISTAAIVGGQRQTTDWLGLSQPVGTNFWGGGDIDLNGNNIFLVTPSAAIMESYTSATTSAGAGIFVNPTNGIPGFTQFGNVWVADNVIINNATQNAFVEVRTRTVPGNISNVAGLGLLMTPNSGSPMTADVRRWQFSAGTAIGTTGLNTVRRAYEINLNGANPNAGNQLVLTFSSQDLGSNSLSVLGLNSNPSQAVVYNSNGTGAFTVANFGAVAPTVTTANLGLTTASLTSNVGSGWTGLFGLPSFSVIYPSQPVVPTALAFGTTNSYSVGTSNPGAAHAISQAMGSVAFNTGGLAPVNAQNQFTTNPVAGSVYTLGPSVPTAIRFTAGVNANNQLLNNWNNRANLIENGYAVANGQLFGSTSVTVQLVNANGQNVPLQGLTLTLSTTASQLVTTNGVSFSIGQSTSTTTSLSGSAVFYFGLQGRTSDTFQFTITQTGFSLSTTLTGSVLPGEPAQYSFVQVPTTVQSGVRSSEFITRATDVSGNDLTAFANTAANGGLGLGAFYRGTAYITPAAGPLTVVNIGAGAPQAAAYVPGLTQMLAEATGTLNQIVNAITPNQTYLVTVQGTSATGSAFAPVSNTLANGGAGLNQGSGDLTTATIAGFNNNQPFAGHRFTINVTGATSVPAAQFAGSLVITAGMATAPLAGGTYNLTTTPAFIAGAAVRNLATQATVQLVPGAPARLRFATVAGQDQLVANAPTPNVQWFTAPTFAVEVLDAANNVVRSTTSGTLGVGTVNGVASGNNGLGNQVATQAAPLTYTLQVTAANVLRGSVLLNNTNTETFTTTASVSTAGNLVTFTPFFSHRGVQTGVQVTVSSVGLLSTTATFNLAQGAWAATTLAVVNNTLAGGNSLRAGIPVNATAISVRVINDNYNLPVGGVTVNLTQTGVPVVTGNAGTTTTAVSDNAGFGVANYNLLATGSTGTVTLTWSAVNGTNPVLSTNVTVGAGEPGRVTITGNPASVQVGVASNFVVGVTDWWGNPIDQAFGPYPGQFYFHARDPQSIFSGAVTAREFNQGGNAVNTDGPYDPGNAFYLGAPSYLGYTVDGSTTASRRVLTPVQAVNPAQTGIVRGQAPTPFVNGQYAVTAQVGTRLTNGYINSAVSTTGVVNGTQGSQTFVAAHATVRLTPGAPQRLALVAPAAPADATQPRFGVARPTNTVAVTVNFLDESGNIASQVNGATVSLGLAQGGTQPLAGAGASITGTGTAVNGQATITGTLSNFTQPVRTIANRPRVVASVASLPAGITGIATAPLAVNDPSYTQPATVYTEAVTNGVNSVSGTIDLAIAPTYVLTTVAPTVGQVLTGVTTAGAVAERATQPVVVGNSITGRVPTVGSTTQTAQLWVVRASNNTFDADNVVVTMGTPAGARADGDFTAAVPATVTVTVPAGQQFASVASLTGNNDDGIAQGARVYTASLSAAQTSADNVAASRATITVNDPANRGPRWINPIPDVRATGNTPFDVDLETANAPIFTDDDTNGPGLLAGAQTLTYTVRTSNDDVVNPTLVARGGTRGNVVRLTPGRLAGTRGAADLGVRTVAANSSATITVTAADPAGLTATTSFNWTALSALSVGTRTLDGVSVYPNPVADFVTVTRNFERAGDVTITITNVLGQRVYAKSLRASGLFTETISTDNLQSGMYFLEVSTNGQRHVEKIVKR